MDSNISLKIKDGITDTLDEIEELKSDLDNITNAVLYKKALNKIIVRLIRIQRYYDSYMGLSRQNLFFVYDYIQLKGLINELNDFVLKGNDIQDNHHLIELYLLFSVNRIYEIAAKIQPDIVMMIRRNKDAEDRGYNTISTTIKYLWQMN